MNYLVTNIFQYIRRYFRKYFPKEVRGWVNIIRFFGPIGLIAMMGLIAVVVYVNPRAPNIAYIATGQEGSSYKQISEQFKKIFEKNDLKLELVATSGLGEGLRGLDSDASSVSASFLPVGIAQANQYPNLVSLGSVQYAPIWFFYTGSVIETNDPFEYFSEKNISVGTRNNVTNDIYRKLYFLNQKNEPDPKYVMELSNNEAAERLMAGKLDAVFIIDSYESETVQKLLKAKDIHIMNFPLADAYVKNVPFLQKLVIPKGAINLQTVYPQQDITILATTNSLLVEKSMHPALQWAYLLAAKEVGTYPNAFFSPANYFPHIELENFPLSPIAKRFYDQGIPVFFSYLPLKIASFVEEVWFYVLAFVLVIYPLFLTILSARHAPSLAIMERLFFDIRDFDEIIPTLETPDQVLEMLKILDRYEQAIYQTSLMGKNARFYFNLKSAINAVRKDAEAKLASLKVV